MQAEGKGRSGLSKRYEVCPRCALWRTPFSSLFGNMSFMFFGCLSAAARGFIIGSDAKEPPIDSNCDTTITLWSVCVWYVWWRAVIVFYLFRVPQGHDKILQQQRTEARSGTKVCSNRGKRFVLQCFSLLFFFGSKTWPPFAHIRSQLLLHNNRALAAHQPTPLFVLARAATAVAVILVAHCQLDGSSSGREDAFRATVDSQWALLAFEDDDNPLQPSLSTVQGGGNSGEDGALPGGNRKKSTKGATMPPLRSPFLVCLDRHPDAIAALENVVHRTQTQLTYSRGDTACLLVGLRLDEVEAVRLSEGVHVIEPLPQPAKLSRSLHAKLKDPIEPLNDDVDMVNTRGGSSLSSSSSSGGEGVSKNSGSGGDSQEERQPLAPPRDVFFNHGEGLPTDLDISLTPGTWGSEMGQTWKEHLTSFESTAHLWDEHLRERFLWTQRQALLDGDEATVGGVTEDKRNGDKKRRDLADEGAPSSTAARISRKSRTALVEAHGLEDLEKLWNQAADHSSKDGACDFGRLRATSASGEENNTDAEIQESGEKPKRRDGKRVRRGWGGRSGTSKRDHASARDGEKSGGGKHDRVVLRGAGSLGSNPRDNAHCLLTVLAYLATRPEVAYVDDLPQVFELNVEAAWITQSGEATTYSIWDQGIDGRTEVYTW